MAQMEGNRLLSVSKPLEANMEMRRPVALETAMEEAENYIITAYINPEILMRLPVQLMVIVRIQKP